MPSKRKKTCSKERHADLTLWADLSENERREFLSAYRNIGAQWNRSKHSFLQQNGLRSLFAYHLSMWEQFLKMKTEIEELKGKTEGVRIRDEIMTLLSTANNSEGASLCEAILNYAFRMLVETRDFETLQWLAEFVKEHRHSPFPIPYAPGGAALNQTPFLHGVILKEFMKLSGSEFASLHSAAHPLPTHLPTKQFLRNEVSKHWNGADLAKGGKKRFYAALDELGLRGLPEGKTGPKQASRREAANAKRLLCGDDGVGG